MPNEEELHGQVCHLKDQHRQIENRTGALDARLQKFEDRVGAALIDISKSLVKLETMVEVMIEYKPKIDKIDSIDARLSIIEKEHEQENEGFINLLLNYKVWVITTIIVLFAKYGMAMSIATFNNK